jgi:2-hydroxychromene-2-carboxylate isomerase
VSSNIEFLFDFASPNAYLSYHVLTGVAERNGATLTLTPVLLGGLFKLTNNQAPMVAFGEVKGKLDYDMLETQRFIAAHQLDKFTFNPHFPINTIMLMRGFIAAQQLGVVDDYVAVNLSAMWEQEQNMGDPEVAARRVAVSGSGRCRTRGGDSDAASERCIAAQHAAGR